jgi:hypothetical protein
MGINADARWQAHHTNAAEQLFPDSINFLTGQPLRNLTQAEDEACTAAADAAMIDETDICQASGQAIVLREQQAERERSRAVRKMKPGERTAKFVHEFTTLYYDGGGKFWGEVWSIHKATGDPYEENNEFWVEAKDEHGDVYPMPLHNAKLGI